MGYTYDFKNNELYSADDINSIRASFISSGVLGSTVPALNVTISDGKVFVSSGMAVFADGSSLRVDDEGVELEYTEGAINYVYLLNDSLLNKNTVNISTEAPVGDYVLLAEIDETGTISDKRTYATAKYAALGIQRCYVDLTIPGKTNGWDGTEFVLLGTLNVDKNLRAVTLQNKYDYYYQYKEETKFIRDSDIEFTVYNQSTSSTGDVVIRITPEFEIWAKSSINYNDAALIFENMTEGSVEYA